jgi:hypothetical protein
MALTQISEGARKKPRTLIIITTSDGKLQCGEYDCCTARALFEKGTRAFLP